MSWPDRLSLGITLGPLLLALAASLPGCSRGPSAIPVSGAVTLRGEPLDQGYIEFTPLGGAAQMSGAEIKAGRYSIPAAAGLAEGSYQVRISSSEGGAAVEEEAPGESNITAKERIPAEYNTASRLEVEVKASAENTFDFAIP